MILPDKATAAEVSERMMELTEKKYSNCDPQGNGGLSVAEEAELKALKTWQMQVFTAARKFFETYCDLEVDDIVEATFEDGTVYAKISERFNGKVYHISTLRGGGGCTIEPQKVRKLSPLEVFNLEVNGPQP